MSTRQINRRLSVFLLVAAGWMLVAPVQANITYLHTDIQGTVILETDQNRNVAQRFEYEPYGLPRQTMEDRPGYTGHVHDADSGLVYMQQRYYDPEIGQFLSVDPVGVNIANGANFSRYWYANNNPFSYVDPDGRDSYLVSRRLQGTLGSAGNHNFIVHGAKYPGDPAGTVRSFGDRGDDTLGEVNNETTGFSEGTHRQDQSAWDSLAGNAPMATFRPINASDETVSGLADSLVPGGEYSAVPLGDIVVPIGLPPGPMSNVVVPPPISGGANSNSAAGAIASSADGGSTSVDNGQRQPGSEPAAVGRVKFRDH